MATNHYIPGAVPSSLDDTADYPPLPESFAVPGARPPEPQASAASHATDTWVMPKLVEEQAPAATPAPAAQPSTDELLRPYREERMQLRAELAAVNRERDELTRQLDAQAGSVRELERRVQEEAERTARARAEATQLHGRSAGIASELEARGAELRDAEDKLRASESQSRDLESRLREAEAECAALRAGAEADRSRLRAGAEAELSGLRARFAAAEAELSELRARFAAAEAELALLAGERERQAATQSDAERERARREAALAHSQHELGELHRRVAAHGEVLRRVEGQRYIFDAQLREREAMLDEAQARLREATEARERIDADLAAAIARAEQAEHRLAQRAEPTISPSPAEPPVSTTPAVDPALVDRIASLEAELADNRAQLGSLQQDLASAEQSGQALRAELDQRSTFAPGPAGGAALPWPAAAEEPTIAPAQVAGAAADSPTADVMPLLVRTSGDAGIVHVLGRRTTIGRTPDNDLRIEADYASRHHAVVLVNPEHTVIEDLNSTNGVYVNDARVARRELREGDVIRIGDISFRFLVKPVST